jgi:hypothetical protein
MADHSGTSSNARRGLLSPPAARHRLVVFFRLAESPARRLRPRRLRPQYLSRSGFTNRRIDFLPESLPSLCGDEDEEDDDDDDVIDDQYFTMGDADLTDLYDDGGMFGTMHDYDGLPGSEIEEDTEDTTYQEEWTAYCGSVLVSSSNS